ncbi:hypothetical protein RhiirA5_414028 [Rhizophagus irregularis]|uniref:HECT domain-containing protein n=1 Tax=Rhizophagus irregularis TaxID=588596 RepID=A0A2N0NXY2_9GLOM|nr:hypothetical protein RhiirA5_429711 [Rhizophagus irregularis]PKC10713.1 hypothetical protein RhiirA5_414028 [Rhizophagus irregularis]
MASEILGECKKQGCGCQTFRLINNSSNDEKCYFCDHGSGFHELLSEVDTSIYTLGPCRKNGSCDCRRFKKKITDAEKCIYCNHYFAFHESWNQHTHFSPASTHPAVMLSHMPNNIASEPRFTSVRQELLSSFRPSISIPLNNIQSGQRPRYQRRNISNLQNEQPMKKLKFNYLILLDKVNSTNIPKSNSNLWNSLLEIGFIKQDITLFENTIDRQINDLFPILAGQEWKIYNPSSGKLKDLHNIEKTIEFLKNYSTKYARKLYIGPTERDLTVLNNIINNEHQIQTATRPTRDPSDIEIDIEQESSIQAIVASSETPTMSSAASPETLASPVLMDSDELAAFVNSSPFLDNNIDFIDLTSSTIVDDEQVFENIINDFKNKIVNENQENRSNFINLRRSDKETVFADFIYQIRNWNDLDFINKPFLRIDNEVGIDTGGIFNDSLNKVFENFIDMKDPRFGGEGSFFIGEFSKTISESIIVEFVEEAKIFGDILFLTIVHGGPFPHQINESLIKYCFGYEDNITVNDLGSLNPIMHKLALDINNSSENVDLSLINGFNEWAENNNIQPIQYSSFSINSENLKKLSKKVWYDELVNKRINQLNAIKRQVDKFGFLKFLHDNNITVDILLKYLYNECYLASDFIEKLQFNRNLTEAELSVKQYLIDWISLKDPITIGKLCTLITGFKHPRGTIKVMLLF